ncbi:FAD:protein FMN transferase [Jutongia hominis]|nr:FAD:protein FMN transferase [Jutongia hominis]
MKIRFYIKKRIIHRLVSMQLIGILIISLFTGCAKETSSLTTSGFAFNTTYTITVYQGGTQKTLDTCVSKCADYEQVFSRTSKNSELYQINQIEALYLTVVERAMDLKDSFTKKRSYTKEQCESIVKQIEQKKTKENTVKYSICQDGSITFEISALLERIVKKGLEYSKKSDGRFDIAIEPVSSLWDFTVKKPTVPDEQKIEKALAYVDYQKIALDDQKLTFQMPGMGIDLGGIAKGFIADELKAYLEKKGVKSAVIDLGGNVLCIGQKDPKTPFHIGIQQPFADRNETIAAVSVDGLSIVSSGIYERYFKTKDGTLYHHILNPKTGYSYDNDLMAVTILSKKSVDGDGLSTSCFAMGKKEGLAFINNIDGVEAVFITKDEKMHYSKGFSKYLYKQK